MKVKKTANREPVPAGVFPARCYKMMHYGTVRNNYDGTLRNTLRLDFELPTKTKVFDEAKGPQPLSISKEYTASFNEKSNLYHDMSSWFGDLSKLDEFEMTDVVGNECFVNVQHKVSKSTGNTYAYVAAIMPVPEGSVVPEQVNPSFVWDYEENFDEDVLMNMHEFFQDKIRSSIEYQAKMNPVDIQDAPMPTEADDPGVQDLPF